MSDLDSLQIALLDVDTIRVKKDRQRDTFNQEELLALATDIRDNQLLHPCTVTFSDDPELVVGERRLRSLRALKAKKLPVKFNGELLPIGIAPFLVLNSNDPLILEQAELAENKFRSDLTWQQEERAMLRIEALLSARKEREAEANGTVAKAPTLAEIAEEAGVSATTIMTMKRVADHLDDPDVAKAKTRKDAEKIIAKKATQAHYKELAETTKLESRDHQIAKGDCRELIRKVPDGIVRAIVTDPPYGIDMHKDQSWDGSYHEYDDTEAYCFNLIAALVPEWIRVTEDKAHLYIFCDYTKIEKIRAIVEGFRKDSLGRNIHIAYEHMYLYNVDLLVDEEALDRIKNSEPIFATMPYPFVWSKGNVASYPRAEHWPRKSAEYCLYAIKGNHTQNKLDLCVWDVPQIQNQEHEAGKPQALYEIPVLRSALPGEVVLDCFAGQGNLLRACHANKRKSISFELSDRYFDLLAKAKRETDSGEQNV